MNLVQKQTNMEREGSTPQILLLKLIRLISVLYFILPDFLILFGLMIKEGFDRV